MKNTTTIIALGLAVLLANVASAGNGGGNHNAHHNNHHGFNHNNHHNNHHGFHHNNHHNFHHNNHHNNHHQHGRHNYGYAAPYFIPSIGSSAPRPIVVNTPVNIINPVAAAPARVEKVVAAPAPKVEMGGTVRVTSDKIDDTGKGRAVLKVGRGYKKLVVVQWTDGLAVLEIPELIFKTGEPATIMVFNGPGKLASKVPVTLVKADLSAQVDGQFVAGGR